MASPAASTQESCSGCSWCEKNREVPFTSTWGDVYTSKEACYALKKYLKSVISSPDGLVERERWCDALHKGLPSWLLISAAISCRRRHAEKIQMQRRTLHLRQQQQSSSSGSALFSAFPIKLLKHIASYLAKPSQALFAVSLGNFDMSSIESMSTATNMNRIVVVGGQKRNSDGSLREGTSTICLADMPAESLFHIVDFLPGFVQAYFGLAVAAANDELLNRNSFAIVDDQCWENLDFGGIEKELTARLTDDDIKAVLWCIDAANKVKRLSLAHCVNITGTCLEPLYGSSVIEQIDLSLVGRHESPALLELWHPPQKIDFVVAEFDPPLSYEIVLPILDSIIGSKQCSLQHLQFPQAWRGHCRTTMPFRSEATRRSQKVYSEGRDTFKPDPAFVSFLSQYNELLMNRGTISCVNCSRGLPRSGYELVGSIFSDDDRRKSYMFGNQNHTCSQCMKHYCYRCDDREEIYQDRDYSPWSFSLESCGICEREQCVDCSGIYWCESCLSFYCLDCKECKTCSGGCENKICSDCALQPSQCQKCKEVFCMECSSRCEICDETLCYDCNVILPENPECTNCGFGSSMCHTCASERFVTCQHCKGAFCSSRSDSCFLRDCLQCKKRSCMNCVTFRQCSNLVPGRNYRCREYHCVDCPDESSVELARTCSELNKEPCDVCRSMESNVNRSHCDRCSRMCCKTWQIEKKKKLMDDQLNESKKVAGWAVTCLSGMLFVLFISLNAYVRIHIS